MEGGGDVGAVRVGRRPTMVGACMPSQEVEKGRLVRSCGHVLGFLARKLVNLMISESSSKREVRESVREVDKKSIFCFANAYWPSLFLSLSTFPCLSHNIALIYSPHLPS